MSVSYLLLFVSKTLFLYLRTVSYNRDNESNTIYGNINRWLHCEKRR